MSTPAPVRRRKSQAFVELAHSPSQPSASASGFADPKRIGHTPSKGAAANVATSSAAPSGVKRKQREEIASMSKDKNEVPPSAKKVKRDGVSDAPAKKIKEAIKDTTNVMDAPDSDSPRKLYCHQCARSFQLDNMVQCTYKRHRGLRCGKKYCSACLRNRYLRDINDIRHDSPHNHPQSETQDHVEGEDYFFQCPFCSDTCNCRVCMKKRGQAALGSRSPLRLFAKQKEAEAAAAEKEPISTVGLFWPAKKAPKAASKVAQEQSASAKKIQRKSSTSKSVSHVLPQEAPKVVRAPKPPKPKAVSKPLPKTLWTVLPTPLDLEGVLQRMNIREFLLRFSHILDIAKTHREDLEELATGDPYLSAPDEEDEEKSELVGWISETALKAVLMALLSLFIKDVNFETDRAELVKAREGIQSSGANVSKMWIALSCLRNSTSLPLPDSLPAPTLTRQRSTRSVNPEAAAVGCTAQLVPIVGALVEAALRTELVRDDFEGGVAEEREHAAAARELKAAENARWKDLKAAELAASSKGRPKAKQPTATGRQGFKLTKAHQAVVDAARPGHAAALAACDHALAVAAAGCVARCAPLGRDADGRVYFALSPGVAEREAAEELLQGKRGEVRMGRRKAVVEEDERKRMRHWSWFLAVWGRKPEGAVVAMIDDGEEETEGKGKGKETTVEGDDEPRWWGFWHPEQIAKLAEWHAVRHGFDLASKRVRAAADDNAVVDIDDVNVPAAGKGKKPRGRPSNVSSAASSRARTAAEDDSDLTDQSEDERDEIVDDAGVDADGDVQMRTNARGEPVPTRRELRALARGLKQYAEQLEWRIRRACKDDGEKAGLKGKGKAVGRSEPIAPASFYG
ncbi:uncharacterized protein BXZ73DRAFT_41158 [Epithele typhae]|uniref:uncharacterized protein n=1 Tax=Epithele typhae TaxID=378194 RepID=UPI0020076062|nr:uncharacterized protein BXZ73DRAFT_41158 [Epithele typhae]KAH9942475.1 hypothetical protein BXZ73DRAFT_41158 [Epithele typhae]